MSERVKKHIDEGNTLEESINRSISFYSNKIQKSNAKWAKEAIQIVQDIVDCDDKEARQIISKGLDGFMGEIYGGLRKNYG